jgi:hypothetical protein
MGSFVSLPKETAPRQTNGLGASGYARKLTQLYGQGGRVEGRAFARGGLPIVRVGCREFKRIGDKPQPNLTPSDFGFWQWMRTREALSASR